MALAERLPPPNSTGRTTPLSTIDVRLRRRRLPDGRYPHEAASLAARWALGADRLLRRQRHLDRRRDQGWFTDDTPKRFEAYGWHVQPGIDGHVSAARGVEKAQADGDRHGGRGPAARR
jgi:hypothetical protein